MCGASISFGSGKCAAKAYYVDQSFVGLGNITIEKDATLSFPNSGTLSLQTDSIYVDGTLQVGSASCPIGSGTGRSLRAIKPSGVCRELILHGVFARIVYFCRDEISNRKNCGDILCRFSCSRQSDGGHRFIGRAGLALRIF